MNTLASQKQYFDKIIRGNPTKEVTDHQKKATKYGSLSEKNFVSTLVGKILPVYYQDYVFFFFFFFFFFFLRRELTKLNHLMSG